MAAPEPFCTVAQYEARFGTVADNGILGECLADASAAIRLVLSKRGIDWEHPSADLTDRMMRTCRAMAHRIMPSETDIPMGATQMSITAGSYQQTYSMPSAYSMPRLIKDDYDMLGIAYTRVGWAPLGGHDD